MTRVVRSRMAVSSAACTMRSLSASSALVASSSSSSGGVLQHGAGNRDALALAAREAHAALAQEGVVALGQGADEIVGKGGARRGLHLGVAGVGAAVADVLQRAGGKDHRVLRHHGDVLAYVVQRQLRAVARRAA